MSNAKFVLEEHHASALSIGTTSTTAVLLYILIYTRIGCNNEVWVWKILFHKVKIQVLKFSKWAIENCETGFLQNFLEIVQKGWISFKPCAQFYETF